MRWYTLQKVIIFIKNTRLGQMGKPVTGTVSCPQIKDEGFEEQRLFVTFSLINIVRKSTYVSGMFLCYVQKTYLEKWITE